VRIIARLSAPHPSSPKTPPLGPPPTPSPAIGSSRSRNPAAPGPGVPRSDTGSFGRRGLAVWPRAIRFDLWIGPIAGSIDGRRQRRPPRRPSSQSRGPAPSEPRGSRAVPAGGPSLAKPPVPHRNSFAGTRLLGPRDACPRCALSRPWGNSPLRCGTRGPVRNEAGSPRPSAGPPRQDPPSRPLDGMRGTDHRSGVS